MLPAVSDEKVTLTRVYLVLICLGSAEKAASDGTAIDGNFVRSRKVPFQTHRPT
jgi:hypothetical protein